MILQLFIELFQSLNKLRKWQLTALVGLMIAVSLIEVVGVGSVFPYISAILNPEMVLNNRVVHSFSKNFIKIDSSNIILVFTTCFLVLILIGAILKLILLWSVNKTAFTIGGEIGERIFRNSLYQSYEIHLKRNSSEIIDAVASKTNGVINIVVMAMNLVSSFIVFVGLLLAILFINPYIAGVIFGGLVIFYSISLAYVKSRLYINSKNISIESIKLIKILQEGLGGIRDILLDGSQEVFCRSYSRAEHLLRRAQISNNFISLSPRYVVEAIGISLIVLSTYFLSGVGKLSILTIPTIATIAFGLQKLLPIAQLGYSSWTSIKGNQATLREVLNLIGQLSELSATQIHQSKNIRPVRFNELTLKNISFRYSQAENLVLKDISIDIKKGERIGIVGTTGGGKSTLLDVIMGLLLPTGGEIYIDSSPIKLLDNRNWQSTISHVPQYIFLSDTSIAENIAFGVNVEDINYTRLVLAAKNACIDDFIESLPEKYQSMVGERGVQLSGGQRQRIGIARALYKESSMIIFDESTSALDSETESRINDSLYKINKNTTLLIVAHRISSLKHCSRIIEIECGCIKRICSYEDINSFG